MALWDVASGRLLWKRPTDFIQKTDEYSLLESFAWSPDQKLIATGSANGTVQLWNVRDGAFLWRTDVAKSGVSAVAFSPNGETIAATTYGSDDPTAATLIDVVTGKPVKELLGNRCGAIGIAFDPSGEQLSIGNLNGNVVRWNLLTGKPIDTADCKSRFSYAGERSFSQDLSLSIRRTTAEQLVLEEVSGKVIKTLPLNDSRMRSLINSRAHKAVVEEYGSYHVYDLSSGAEKKLGDCVSGSAFDLSDDGRHFAQSCDGFKTGIKITDLGTDKSWLLDGHPSMINAMEFSPDFALLAVGGNDGNAYLLDRVTHSLKRTLLGNGSRLTALTFSPDGRALITGDEESVLRKWDVSTGAILKEARISDRSDDINKIGVSADGQRLMVLIRSAALILTSELQNLRYLSTPEGYSSTSGGMGFTSSSVPVQAAAFTLSGIQAVTGHPDGTVRFWNVSDGRQLRKFKIADAVMFIQPVDDKHFVILGRLGENARFELINSMDGKVVRQSKDFEASYLEKVFVSRDGSRAAVTDIGGDTVICDLDTMTLRTFDNGLSGSDSVAFSKDAKTFFIGGENQNLSIYDTATLKREWSLLSDFALSEREEQLTREQKARVAVVKENKDKRDKEGAAYVRANQGNVYVTFEHFGDMSDPGNKRMLESDRLKESKDTKPASASNAVWLRLHNDTTLPIKVPTESMYMPDPKCFHQFPNGDKMSGLCKDREIGVWFGVKDSQDKWIPYGFDFGSEVVLLPNSSVVFPVPLTIWEKGYWIVFEYSFQNLRASENDRDMDYGEKVEIKISKATVRKP